MPAIEPLLRPRDLPMPDDGPAPPAPGGESHEQFFRRMLGDVDEPCSPFGPPAAMAGATVFSDAHLPLAPQGVSRVHALAARFGVDSASLFHLAWALLLARLCARDDVVFGSVLPGAGSEPASSGTVAKVLPLRVRITDDGLAASLRRVQRQRLDLARHAAAPLGLAQRCSAVAESLPLFSSVLECRQGVAASPGNGEHHAGAFPLALTVDEAGGSIVLGARMPATLDPQRLCVRMQHALMQLVDALSHDPDMPLCRVDVLPLDERQRLLVDWNPVQAPGALNGTVQGLLETRAAATPDAVAVIDDSIRLSHAALHAQANRLAHHLRALGVGPDVRVAVCMVRSADLLIALLAVLKAGGAYVPLDPAYPAERLAYMLGDSAPAVVLTHAQVSQVVQGLLKASLGERPLIDLRDPAGPTGSWQSHPATALDPAAVGLTPEHLAYVAYTSGSTGVPKGVANTIAGLANRLAWFADTIATEAPVTAMKTSICFVDSLTEMLQTLASGGCLVVFDNDTAKDTQRFAQQVQRHGVTTLVVVPSLLTQLLDVDAPAFASVRTLICSGERLPPELVRDVRRVHPRARLLNFYGSSEVNGDATFHDCNTDDASSLAGSPIGRPIANLRIYLLDSRLRPVPLGITGEIHVGGVGLARGYLGRVDLTAERFLDDSFVPGGRIYKTGDLARYRDDGVLEFLGRNDHQVKVRGFRVELGEIEASLKQHPAVRQVVVMGREDIPGDMRLVAYLAAGEPGDRIVEALRQRLRDSLPDYMMPSHFVFLDAMPMTPSGKLDRKSLPAPTLGSAPGAGAPRTPLEAAVARIMCEVLKAVHVGVGDDFFLVGGHSLLAARFVGRLNRELSLNLNLRTVFENSTVEKLALAIGSQQAHIADRSSGAAPEPVEPDVLSLIRAGQGGRPVFFVHDGFGETLAYRALAHLLRPELPVYGLYPQAAGGLGMVHTRIPAMAAHYVARLRSVQPHGPYVLAGLCAGGVIAFEMARQLQQQGQSIGAVVLIDANDVAARKRIGRFALSQVKRHWVAFARRGSWSQPLATLRAGFDFGADLLGLATHQLGTRMASAVHNHRARKLQACLDRGEDPPALLRRLSVDQIYNFAELNHVDPGTLNGEVLLLRATEGNGDIADEPFMNLYADPLLGWARRVKGSVKAVDVPGGHYSMFQPPHVKGLADRIQAHIDAALAR